MKKTLFLAVLILTGCGGIPSGIYYSECYALGVSTVALDLKNDRTFTYKFDHTVDLVVGKWEISQDTLLLSSPSFLREHEPYTPIFRRSDFVGVDKYLIKNRKLYLIKKAGVEKHCALTKSER